MSEQVTLQLVPWSCAVDDSHRPATLTCTPAYLQLSTEPGKQLPFPALHSQLPIPLRLSPA